VNDRVSLDRPVAEHGFAPAMLDGAGLIVDNEAGLVFVL
jgi:hypothetical protein